MKWDHIESHWREFAGSARAHWSILTDDDWHAMTGTRGHLIGSIQKRYEVASDEAAKQVEDRSNGLMDVLATPSSR
jgi:uncharacterized protein YjbJ (UPF0337 family)